MNVPCIETTVEGRKIHAWRSTGLDIVDGVLCSTRVCTWCQRHQHRAYGAQAPRSWTDTTVSA